MIIMKNKETIVRSSMSFPALIAGIAMFSGLYLFHNAYTRQYKPEVTVQADKDKDAGAEGMMQYFFNARKNPATNKMDYAAMLKTEQQIMKTSSWKRAMSSMGFNWISLGPTNIGGRTRAILIDKNDASGQTIFAGGISGGIWKSKNGGFTWDSINDTLPNICVSCIAQDANGNIYFGTGEGFSLYYQGEAFSTGILGGGIFKSTNDGATFTRLKSTIPASPNNDAILWAYTNRIAIQPNNPNIIYAATNAGLMISQDGGTTFNYATTNNTTKLTNNTLDVKISADGNVVMACYNGTGYYAYPTTSSVTNFTPMHNSGYGAIPTSGGGRIEFGIAPSNSNYAYAAVIGPGDNFIGVYMTMTAVSANNGGNWREIGPGGSLTFDPYGFGTGEHQGTYDNAIGISPSNPGNAFFAGTTLWNWQQSSPTDTAGNWKSITVYFGYPGDPQYVHPDMHTIVFEPNNANTMFIGCDGGIYKSTDGSKSWQAINRNYDVTQMYAVAFSPYVNKNGEGVIGGTQDNGTPYVSGTQFYYKDAVELGGGDGGQSAISSINPNAYYVSSDANSLLRSVNLSGYGNPSNAYSGNEGLNKGANIDSVAGLGSGCFVDPIALWENAYDTKTLDSLLWVADKSYTVGDTVYPISPNGNIAFPYVINKSVVKGDSVLVQNRVVSKIATAFSASNGVWMMMQAIDFQDPEVWMPIGGPLSQPDAFSGSNPVHCMVWSPNGDALFVGTESGQFFRFSNLDSIVDTAYTTGALYSVPNGGHAVANPRTRVISTNLSTPLGVGGADILSIAVDPKNGNNVIVTTGSYTGGTHVYFSNNALASSGVTFKSAQGNLPEMPVYGSVMDVIHSPYPTGAVVATEHGVYSTTNITAASPVWSSDNNGMANTIVCAIGQQSLPPYQCNNSGSIYLGTHGRGMWVDTTFLVPTGIASIKGSRTKIDMKIYPNPMNTRGTLAFTLPASDKVTVTIYNMEGQVIQEIPVGSQAPGLHTVSINSQDMAVGAYLATITGTNFRQTTRFVVAR